MKKILVLIFCIAASLQYAHSEEVIKTLDDIKNKKEEFGNNRFLPNSKRFDRHVNSLNFAYKGEFIMGTTLSYGNISTDNSELLLVIDGIDAEATLTSVKPYVGYFYSDDHCVGLRFGYNSTKAILNSADIDLGESNDLEMSIPYVGTDGKGYSYGVFHRTYVGLDKKSRFGLFAEIEFLSKFNNSTTGFETNDIIKKVTNKSAGFEINFNPGAAVYILPNVCTTLSLGFGGLDYKSIKQYDENGTMTGKRETSKMSFKFNVTAINFGVTIHLWRNK